MFKQWISTAIKGADMKYDEKNEKTNILKTTISHNMGNHSRQFNSMGLSDVSMGMERLQVSVLNRALSISHLVNSCTLGQHASEALLKSEPMNVDTRVSKALKPSSIFLERKESSPAIKELNESSIGITNTSGSVEKLIYELEQQRQAEVQDAMKARLEKLAEQTKEHQKEIIRRQANLKCEAEDRALLENQKIQHQKEELEFRESQRLEKLAIEQKQRAKERIQLIKDAEQRAEEKNKKQKEEKRRQIDKIRQCQGDFNEKYQVLLEAVKSCQSRQALQSSCLSSIQLVKSLDDAMKQLVNQCRVGEISDLDLQTAAVINTQLENCSRVIREEAKSINKKAEEKTLNDSIVKQEETTTESISASSSKPVDIVTPASPLPAQDQKPPTDSDNLGCFDKCVCKESLHTYTSLQQFLAQFQSSLLVLTQDSRFKDFTFNCKKAVNIPVNAISDTSGSHLHDKLKKLTYLLLGQPVDISGSTRFSASSHPQGVAFCMDLLAKKLVSQGKTTVSSKPEAAFPIAAIVVALWADFPQFGQLLLAQFHHACPYLVPIFLPQVEGQSDVEFYKSLGYQYDESGTVEKQDKFLKKMSGIMRLYAAILVTRVRQRQNVTHPHGLDQAWRWIACMVNLEPRQDISATLLLDFLDVTGSTMSATYGQQFQKLLHLICKDYFQRIQKIDSHGGPMSRLEAFLQTILKKGNIPQPRGMLPPNFW